VSAIAEIPSDRHQRAAVGDDSSTSAHTSPGRSDFTFRRTYASWPHDKGVAGKVVAQLMGHANVDTTLNVYTQVLDASVRNAVATIGDEFDVTDCSRSRPDGILRSTAVCSLDPSMIDRVLASLGEPVVAKPAGRRSSFRPVFRVCHVKI
jgi:hypothetical protein